MRMMLAKGTTRTGNERGMALLTVMLLLITMTVVGIGSMTMSGLGMKLAGFGQTGESGANAAEACVGTAVKIIQDTIDLGKVDPLYLSSAATPGPVPAGNEVVLQQEIIGQFNNNPDSPQAAP